jgi:hypothetical protein
MYFYNVYVDKKVNYTPRRVILELFANEAFSLKVPALDQKMSL